MSQKIRILFLTPLYPPAVGGAAEHYSQLVSPLANDPQVDRLVVLTERLADAPSEEPLSQGVILRRLPPWLSLPRGSLLERASRRLRTCGRLWGLVPEIVDAERINIVQIHSTAAYTFSPLLARLARRRIALVADLQDNLFDAGSFRRCDRVMCCSENTLARARAFGLPDNKLVLAPVPFSPASVAARVPEREDPGIREPYICFVGSVTARKGIYALLRAFAHFRQTEPAFSLLILGMNHEGNRFLVRTKEDGVIYQGSVSHVRALSLMARAALVVLPSKSEGLPRTCLEAIALGRKVLLPPSVPEFDRHCPEFVLPEVTPESIAGKMKEVLDSDKRPAYPWGEHEPRKVIGMYKRVYEDLLEKSESTSR